MMLVFYLVMAMIFLILICLMILICLALKIVCKKDDVSPENNDIAMLVLQLQNEDAVL